MSSAPAAAPPDDFPGTFIEFQDRFSTEEQCRTYLERLRWPEGFRCPACGHDKPWRTKRGLVMCAKCSRQTSVTAGTIFQDTRKPLRLWFLVMWNITSEKNGVSAQNLQRQLGFSRYETAWAWLHKLRRAMVRPDRDRLNGEVEVDETYVGGVEVGAAGRGSLTKSIVGIAAEIRGSAMGRIRLSILPGVSSPNLRVFLVEAVAPGSTVVTDGWLGYDAAATKGYRHRVANITRSGRLAHEVLPRVHRVASLLKRWLLGTHQGAVRAHYLEYYLDEFTFRFNRRRSSERGKLFYRLVQQALLVDPVPQAEFLSS